MRFTPSPRPDAGITSEEDLPVGAGLTPGPLQPPTPAPVTPTSRLGLGAAVAESLGSKAPATPLPTPTPTASRVKKPEAPKFDPVKQLRDDFLAIDKAYRDAGETGAALADLFKPNFDDAFRSAKTAEDLTKPAQAFASYAGAIKRKLRDNVRRQLGPSATKEELDLNDKKVDDLLGGLSLVAKTALRYSKGKTDKLQGFDKFLTDVVLGVRRGALTAAVASEAVERATGDRMFLPEGYEEDPWTSGIAQAVAMGAELALAPEARVAGAAGKALGLPAMATEATTALGARAGIAALDAARGGKEAARIAEAAATRAGIRRGLGQLSAERAAQGQRAVQEFVAGGAGAGAALGLEQTAIQAIPANRPLIYGEREEVNPLTGEKVRVRELTQAPVPTPLDYLKSATMGALGGGFGAVVPALAGPATTRLGGALGEIGSEVAGAIPEAAIQLATEGKIDPSQLLPGIFGAGFVGGAQRPEFTQPGAAPAPAPAAPPMPVTDLEQAAAAVRGEAVPPPPPAPPAPAEPVRLPTPPMLSKAKPRYGQNIPAFESDIDKAIFMLRSQETNNPAQYRALVNWLQQETGLTEDDLKVKNGEVRKHIRDTLAAQKAAGLFEEGKPFNVPARVQPAAAPPAAAPTGDIAQMAKDSYDAFEAGDAERAYAIADAIAEQFGNEAATAALIAEDDARAQAAQAVPAAPEPQVVTQADVTPVEPPVTEPAPTVVEPAPEEPAAAPETPPAPEVPAAVSTAQEFLGLVGSADTAVVGAFGAKMREEGRRRTEAVREELARLLPPNQQDILDVFDLMTGQDMPTYQEEAELIKEGFLRRPEAVPVAFRDMALGRATFMRKKGAVRTGALANLTPMEIDLPDIGGQMIVNGPEYGGGDPNRVYTWEVRKLSANPTGPGNIFEIVGRGTMSLDEYYALEAQVKPVEDLTQRMAGLQEARWLAAQDNLVRGYLQSIRRQALGVEQATNAANQYLESRMPGLGDEAKARIKSRTKKVVRDMWRGVDPRTRLSALPDAAFARKAPLREDPGYQRSVAEIESFFVDPFAIDDAPIIVEEESPEDAAAWDATRDDAIEQANQDPDVQAAINRLRNTVRKYLPALAFGVGIAAAAASGVDAAPLALGTVGANFLSDWTSPEGRARVRQDFREAYDDVLTVSRAVFNQLLGFTSVSGFNLSYPRWRDLFKAQMDGSSTWNQALTPDQLVGIYRETLETDPALRLLMGNPADAAAAKAARARLMDRTAPENRQIEPTDVITFIDYDDKTGDPRTRYYADVILLPQYGDMMLSDGEYNFVPLGPQQISFAGGVRKSIPGASIYSSRQMSVPDAPTFEQWRAASKENEQFVQDIIAIARGVARVQMRDWADQYYRTRDYMPSSPSNQTIASATAAAINLPGIDDVVQAAVESSGITDELSSAIESVKYSGARQQQSPFRTETAALERALRDPDFINTTPEPQTATAYVRLWDTVLTAAEILIDTGGLESAGPIAGAITRLLDILGPKEVGSRGLQLFITGYSVADILEKKLLNQPNGEKAALNQFRAELQEFADRAGVEYPPSPIPVGAVVKGGRLEDFQRATTPEDIGDALAYDVEVNEALRLLATTDFSQFDLSSPEFVNTPEFNALATVLGRQFTEHRGGTEIDVRGFTFLPTDELTLNKLSENGVITYLGNPAETKSMSQYTLRKLDDFILGGIEPIMDFMPLATFNALIRKAAATTPELWVAREVNAKLKVIQDAHAALVTKGYERPNLGLGAQEPLATDRARGRFPLLDLARVARDKNKDPEAYSNLIQLLSSAASISRLVGGAFKADFSLRRPQYIDLGEAILRQLDPDMSPQRGVGDLELYDALNKVGFYRTLVDDPEYLAISNAEMAETAALENAASTAARGFVAPVGRDAPDPNKNLPKGFGASRPDGKTYDAENLTPEELRKLGYAATQAAEDYRDTRYHHVKNIEGLLDILRSNALGLVGQGTEGAGQTGNAFDERATLNRGFLSALSPKTGMDFAGAGNISTTRRRRIQESMELDRPIRLSFDWKKLTSRYAVRAYDYFTRSRIGSTLDINPPNMKMFRALERLVNQILALPQDADMSDLAAVMQFDVLRKAGFKIPNAKQLEAVRNLYKGRSDYGENVLTSKWPLANERYGVPTGSPSAPAIVPMLSDQQRSDARLAFQGVINRLTGYGVPDDALALLYSFGDQVAQSSPPDVAMRKEMYPAGWTESVEQKPPKFLNTKDGPIVSFPGVSKFRREAEDVVKGPVFGLEQYVTALDIDLPAFERILSQYQDSVVRLKFLDDIILGVESGLLSRVETVEKLSLGGFPADKNTRLDIGSLEYLRRLKQQIISGDIMSDVAKGLENERILKHPKLRVFPKSSFEKFAGLALGIGSVLSAGVAEAAETVSQVATAAVNAPPFYLTADPGLNIPALIAGGALLYTAIPAVTWMVRNINNSQSMLGLRAALETQGRAAMQKAGLTVPPRSDVSQLLMSPQVRAAIQQSRPAPSPVRQTAATVGVASSKALRRVQELQTEINKLVTTVGEGMVSPLGRLLKLDTGIDPDTQRALTLFSLAKWAGSMAKLGADEASKMFRAFRSIPDQTLPETAVRLSKDVQYEMADGDATAVEIERHLQATYDSNTRELLELIIKGRGILPAQYMQDPVIQTFIAAMPLLVNNLASLGLINKHLANRAEGFLIVTMGADAAASTFSGRVMQAMQAAKNTLLRRPQNSRAEMFSYGRGYEATMKRADFDDLNRDWEVVADRPGSIDLKWEEFDPLTGTVVNTITRTVSKTFDPRTGVIEADNYVRFNPQTQAYENPWSMLESLPNNEVRVTRDWSAQEYDGNGILRDFSTAAQKTLSYMTREIANGNLYAELAKNPILDGQVIWYDEANIPGQNLGNLPGGSKKWQRLDGKRYGALNGKVVRKDVVDLIDRTRQDGLGLRAAEAMMREFSKTRTLLSFGYHVANLVGNYGALVVQGGSIADVAKAMQMIATDDPLVQFWKEQGAYEGTTAQDLIRQSQRSGFQLKGPTDVALSSVGKALETVAAKTIQPLLNTIGPNTSGDKVMVALKDIGRTVSPVASAKLVDDIFRTALAVRVMEEGGSPDGAARRMKEDMYSVVPPISQLGRWSRALVLPFAGWPIWSFNNGLRIGLQNWPKLSVAVVQMTAMAMMNEAIVFAGEPAEVREARKVYERQMEYIKTPGMFPSRVYITPSLSMRTDVADMMDTYRRLGDILDTFVATGKEGVPLVSRISEAVDAYNGFRALPVRPGGPIIGTGVALSGRNPMRPGQPLPMTERGYQEMAAEAIAPGPTKMARALAGYGAEPTAGEITERGEPGGLEQVGGPAGMIAKGLGPFETVNFDRDLARTEAERKGIERRFNSYIGLIRKQADYKFSPVKISVSEAEAEIKSLLTLKEALLKRNEEKQKAITVYRDALTNAIKGYRKPEETPTYKPTTPALPENPYQSGAAGAGLMALGSLAASRRRKSAPPQAPQQAAEQLVKDTFDALAARDAEAAVAALNTEADARTARALSASVGNVAAWDERGRGAIRLVRGNTQRSAWSTPPKVSDGALGPGYYVTGSRSAAAGYGENVVEYDVTFNNPLIITVDSQFNPHNLPDARESEAPVQEAIARALNIANPRKWAEKQMDDWGGIKSSAVAGRLRSLGHDGIWLVSSPSGDPMASDATLVEAVALSPTQFAMPQ